MSQGPIPAHWDFIAAAYAVTVIGLMVLTLGVALNLRRWAKRAREEERP